jgi:hypothetical protein
MKPVKRRRPIPGQIRRIQRYPVDESTGAPLLPIQVGVIVVHELGKVITDRLLYHTDRYIFPVGYRSSRQFLSMVDPEKTVTYESRIVDGGDSPKFIVTPEDSPELAAEGTSATGAWTIVIKGAYYVIVIFLLFFISTGNESEFLSVAAYAIRSKEHTSSASGPDYFGLSQGVIMKLIQDMPESHHCKNYCRQTVRYIHTKQKPINSERY